MQATFLHDCYLTALDLACRRGERVLFRELSFALAPGDALQVTGANGVGKSSLIRILAGLLRPFHGSVESEGAVGLVDERPALDPQLALGKALAFWAGFDGTGIMAHEAISDRLGLSGLLDVPVRYLSTGQKKRAALARLLGQKAPVWLLDEPLNGLDTSASKTVESLIAEHCEAGGIVLVASHQAIALPSPRRIDLAEFAP